MIAMKRRRAKKGVVGYFMVFVTLSVFLLFLFAFATPFLIQLDTAFYTAGESILDGTGEWINQINDTTVKDQIQSTINSGKQSIPDQIDILGFFFQYAWAVIILVILFVIFMYTRQTVESGIR